MLASKGQQHVNGLVVKTCSAILSKEIKYLTGSCSTEAYTKKKGFMMTIVPRGLTKYLLLIITIIILLLVNIL